MSQDFSEAIAHSWTIPFWPTLAVLISALVYLRGWRRARCTRPQELPLWRAMCFMGGLLVFWLALASPIDALGQFLLLAHMTQHLALMSIAPPLLVLGAPTVPLLRGLPRFLIRDEFAPWMQSKTFHKLQRFFTHPLFAWLSMNVALIGWHVPAAYELALRSNNWHEVEHGCFFFTSIAFWWFVLQPWPSKNTWSRWLVLPYLVSADFVNTALSAFLAFCGNVVYPTYAKVPRLLDFSPLNDQIAAGAEMWVFGSSIFLIPAMLVTVQLISSKRWNKNTSAVFSILGQQKQTSTPQPFDLLRTPLIGWILKTRYGRIALQGISLIVILLVILHGLRGTPLTSMNLAGAVVWNIFRPLNLLIFLFAGNLFCMACPFTLPREAARALGLGRFSWPAWLRNKWMAVVLMVLFFWAYEQFALWDSPRATALILLAYIATAFLVDSIFQGANFCKYVCPIGQFNFIASTLSPLELNVKSKQTCATCSTHDCIQGNETQRGCELQLYLPNKVGNLDCTMCMDCVKACPHDNVEITLEAPVRDLVRDPIRSSLRRLSSREDIAVLVLVVTFSSLVNAAVMTAPVSDFLAAMQDQYTLLRHIWVSLLASGLLCGIFLLASAGVAWLLKGISSATRISIVFCRFSQALLPLGMAMWASHLAFHLTTTASSVPAIFQHFRADLNEMLHRAYHPVLDCMQNMDMSPMRKPIALMLFTGGDGVNLLNLQIWMLDAGLLLSLYAGWRIIRQMTSANKHALAMLSVWAVSCTAFYALCVWIFTQPMEMRGMGM